MRSGFKDTGTSLNELPLLRLGFVVEGLGFREPVLAILICLNPYAGTSV